MRRSRSLRNRVRPSGSDRKIPIEDWLDRVRTKASIVLKSPIGGTTVVHSGALTDVSFVCDEGIDALWEMAVPRVDGIRLGGKL